jgi:hypothetical protein
MVIGSPTSVVAFDVDGKRLTAPEARRLLPPGGLAIMRHTGRQTVFDGGGVVTELSVSDLAEAAVDAAAPAETELLPDVTSAWLRGDLSGSGRWSGGSVGFGLDPQLTVMLIYPILTGAFAQVLGDGAMSGWRRVWRRLRRRRPAPAVPASAVAQAERVRDACREQAIAAGVPVQRAELIADAVYGRLVRAAADPAH